jgi:hypothetical protein
MNLFDCLNDLTINKKDFDPNNDEQSKSYEPYMINRFVSMTDMYIPVINEINKYPNIPKETHYRYLQMTLPKRKHFFKYIKKTKDLSIKERSKLMEYFECSSNEADLYINQLTENQIKDILKVYE